MPNENEDHNRCAVGWCFTENVFYNLDILQEGEDDDISGLSIGQLEGNEFLTELDISWDDEEVNFLSTMHRLHDSRD